METLPNNEQIERRAWLVENLAAKGESDPEVMQILASWVGTEERARQAINEPNYFLTIELARICEEAGLQNRTDEFLWAAAQDAFQQGDMATYEKMLAVLKQ